MKLIPRQEVIVWMNNSHPSKKLRRFGTVIYVSFKMNYAIMYLDQAKLKQQVEQIARLSFVSKVELSPRQDLETYFDDKIGQVANLIPPELQSKEKD
ncbi:YlbG family protein [Bombilactobacillus folatiphilus]|uniref:YlbG family protein n=1 Tax=Bombilactobacillus folatiphilus TaxID=2923362 RepID=A0ABY4PBU6_9LACO|nr:YlbG family protein [Bombilactobacillus folatiphilus]UQS82737.1 YlbG family protein [Bombilactobacillus folatiphilus]